MIPEQIFNKDFNLPIYARDIPAIKEYLLKKQGWIYIAHSKNNHLLKIGRTSKNPLVRAKTLSTTGVLHDYEILFSLPVFNQFIVEKQIHNKLKKFRISKEFFSINQETAIATINDFYKQELILLERFFNVDMIKEDINLIEYALKV